MVIGAFLFLKKSHKSKKYLALLRIFRVTMGQMQIIWVNYFKNKMIELSFIKMEKNEIVLEIILRNQKLYKLIVYLFAKKKNEEMN